MIGAIDTNLCVGGPMDGKHHVPEPGMRARTYFQCVEAPPFDFVSADDGAQEVSATSHTYQREQLTVGVDVVFYFWRWDQITVTEVWRRLFNHYTPPP
jgi:hypothetical protein